MDVQIDNSQKISFSINSKQINGSYYSHVVVTPPKQVTKRQRVAIICVLDISGSMDSQATEGQSKESDGFSRLDLVKHSTNTIIHTLEEGDYLGVVTFSDKARTDLQLTEMNKVGKEKALKMIKDMKTEGSTNLWGGIHAGLELSKSPLCDARNTSVVVLTDGEPNVHPPEGNVGALKKYMDGHPLTCTLSLFGYGYHLDTKLLSELTEMGAGCYGYIPDCSMVGTIFVNFLSNALATFSTLMTVNIKTNCGKFLELNGQNKTTSHMGSVQYGLPRNILVKCSGVKDGDDFGTLVIKYGKNLRLVAEVPLHMKQAGDQSKLKSQILRYQYINFLHEANILGNNNKLNQAYDKCKSLVNQMRKVHAQTKDTYLEELIKDIESVQQAQGQVSKALTNQDWWNKWGRHYFPALKIAHSIEMCTNFKDPGLQKYCGLLFREIENVIDTIFIQLPPPTPTIKKYDAQGNVKQVNNMANYYNQYGGCIGGDCLVMTSQGMKEVKQLSCEDYVQTSSGFAKIKCVLVTQVEKQIEMVLFKQGLLITNYHPIVLEGEWVFPSEVKRPTRLYVEKYYNFVIQNGCGIVVNGIQCATLGHGLKGKVIEHDYLGTNAVIEDLKNLQGWNDGIIVIKAQMVKRDPISNLIIGITA